MVIFLIIGEGISFDQNTIIQFINRIESELIYDCCIYESQTYSWKLKITFPNNIIYFVDCFFGTYTNTVQLKMMVYPKKDLELYDQNLEMLKINLKDMFLGLADNTKCIWLEDGQSLELSRILYSETNTTENTLRKFINMVMVETYGTTWWEILVPAEIKKKYNDRMISYKRDVPAFRNVSDYLLSIDANDLMKIMTIKIKQWEPLKTDAIEGAIIEDDKEKLMSLIKAQRVTKVDLWELIFKKYFNEDFAKDWDNFCKNRNHVAHNKLLNHSAFTVFKENNSIVLKSVKDAIEDFENNVISAEDKAVFQKELETIQHDFNLVNDVKVKIESETGIKILTEEQIFEEMFNAINTILDEFEERFYFRKDLHVVTETLGIDDKEINLITVTSKTREDLVCVVAQDIMLIDEPGGRSSLELKMFVNKKETEKCQLEYINGSAEFDAEQGVYIPGTLNELIIDGITEFINSVSDTIDDVIPNPLDEIKSLRYSALKDGGNDPIGEFPCEECEEEAVLLGELVGICMVCGTEQEITECFKCGSYFNPNYEGNDNLCGGCFDYIVSRLEKD